MSHKTENNVKRGVANAFGSLGYFFCFLQWLWAAILYLSLIQSMSSFISSSGGEPVEQPVGDSFALPEPLGTIVLVVVVVLMVAITAYAFISIPRSIVKSSNKIVHKTADTLTPLVIRAQHKQDTKKRRLRITARLTLIIKVLLIIIPTLLAAASGLLDEQSIDYSIVMVIGYGLACLSLLFFAVQYGWARLLRVKLSDLW